MTIYAPVYDHGRKCREIENPEELKTLHGSAVCRCIPGVGFIGSIFRADTLFTTPEAVAKYWAGEPVPASERWEVPA